MVLDVWKQQWHERIHKITVGFQIDQIISENLNDDFSIVIKRSRWGFFFNFKSKKVQWSCHVIVNNFEF